MNSFHVTDQVTGLEVFDALPEERVRSSQHTEAGPLESPVQQTRTAKEGENNPCPAGRDRTRLVTVCGCVTELETVCVHSPR
jgi:hypothetical protein